MNTRRAGSGPLPYREASREAELEDKITKLQLKIGVLENEIIELEHSAKQPKPLSEEDRELMTILRECSNVIVIASVSLLVIALVPLSRSIFLAIIGDPTSRESLLDWAGPLIYGCLIIATSASTWVRRGRRRKKHF